MQKVFLKYAFMRTEIYFVYFPPDKSSTFFTPKELHTFKKKYAMHDNPDSIYNHNV